MEHSLMGVVPVVRVGFIVLVVVFVVVVVVVVLGVVLVVIPLTMARGIGLRGALVMRILRSGSPSPSAGGPAALARSRPVKRRELGLLVARHDEAGGEEVSTIGSKQEASHKKVKDST